MAEAIIAKHGGYRKLKSFQVSQAESFAKEGGFTEKLYRVRSASWCRS